VAIPFGKYSNVIAGSLPPPYPSASFGNKSLGLCLNALPVPALSSPFQAGAAKDDSERFGFPFQSSDPYVQ